MQFQKVYNDTLLIAAAGTVPIPLDWRGGNGALNIVVTGTVNYAHSRVGAFQLC